MAESKRALPGRPLGGIGVPFAGFACLRVLDFSRMLPGPYATQVLSDMGFRVTKIELPHFPDPVRKWPPKIDGVGSLYWMLNQGKKLVVLDFRKPEGMRKLEELLKKSDVLVEGFRPGLMERVGLGFRRVSRINPRLVYCSISGYDAAGPRARQAGHDLNFQAVAGLLGVGDSEGRVSFCGAQIADLAGAMAAVSGVLAALLERRQTGRGRWVKISMAQALHSWLAVALGEMAATGQEPEPRARWWNGAHPFYRLYQTKDGGWMSVAALEKGFALTLLDMLGLSALKPLADDPMAHAEELGRALSKAFKAATAAQWDAAFARKDACVAPVCSLKQSQRFLRGEVPLQRKTGRKA